MDAILLPYFDDASGKKLAGDWGTLYPRIQTLLPPGTIRADWCRERLLTEAAVFGEDCTRYGKPLYPDEQSKDQGGGEHPSSWVPANQLWTAKFSSNRELTKFRRQHPEMFRNPSTFKLEIHAGLWARYWAEREKAGFEALEGHLPSVADDPAVQEDALAAAAQRAAQLRAKKKAGKQ